MALNINGTTGISGVDGSASAASIAGTDANTGLSFASDTVNINTGGSTRATVDSSGRMLIGTTTEGVSGADELTVATSGDTGISIRSGSSNSGKIFFSDATSGAGEYTGGFEYNHSDNSMRTFTNDGAERMRITSTGNVGIGKTSPALLGGDGGRVLHIAGADNPEIVIERTTSGTEAKASLRINDGEDLVFRVQDGSATAIDALFIDSATGLVSINSSSGSLGNEKLFVKNGGASANVAGFFFNNTQDRTNVIIKHDRATGGTNAKMIDFIDQLSGSSGSIDSNGSTTTYNTSSDYRLKENAVAISDGITRLKTLKPYRFNFKVDPTKTVDGFFAHEVTAVPEAVQGEKDGMEPLTFYEEGDTIPSGKQVGDGKTFSETKIRPQSIDHSKLVPLLTAALQEAVAKIEVLETKVAALEAA